MPASSNYVIILSSSAVACCPLTRIIFDVRTESVPLPSAPAIVFAFRPSPDAYNILYPMHLPVRGGGRKTIDFILLFDLLPLVADHI